MTGCESLCTGNYASTWISLYERMEYAITVLCNFEIQVDHLIKTKRTNLAINKKRICRTVDVVSLSDQRVKIK